MELFDDYKLLKEEVYPPNMAKLLEEPIIKKRLYDKFCKESKNDVVILEWKGRFEKQIGQRRPHRSLFDGEFDLAVFKRTADKCKSPLLIGYEVKGLRKRRRRDGRIVNVIPRPHEGVSQARLLLECDANQSYLVTLPRENESENQSIINMIKENRSMGLIFTRVEKRRMKFDTIVEPAVFRDSVNQDRKKVNLGIVSIWERPYCTKIRRQEWARKCEFTLP